MDRRLTRVSVLTAMIWLLGALPSFASQPGGPEAGIGRHAPTSRVTPATALIDAGPIAPPPAPLIHLPGPAAAVQAPAAVRPPLAPDIPAFAPIHLR